MAGAFDIAQGAVTPMADLSSGLSTGMQLAQAHNDFLIKKQQVEQNRQQLEMKKADWMRGRLASASAIVNTQARAMAFKQLGQDAQRAGAPWDPAVEKILSSDEGAKQIQKGIMLMHGISPDPNDPPEVQQMKQKALQAGNDFYYSLGSPDKVEANLSHISELHMQMLGLQRQVNQYQTEQGQKRQEMTQSAAKTANENTEVRGASEGLRYANSIIRSANNPDNRKAYLFGAAAQADMVKTFFVQGSVKEGELKFLGQANPGLLEAVKAYMSGKVGKGPLTSAMWDAMGVLAQHRAFDNNDIIKRYTVGQAPALARAGVDPKEAFSQFPEPEIFNPNGTSSTASSNITDVLPAKPDVTPQEYAALHAHAAKSGVSTKDIAAGKFKSAVGTNSTGIAANAPPAIAPGGYMGSTGAQTGMGVPATSAPAAAPKQDTTADTSDTGSE